MVFGNYSGYRQLALLPALPPSGEESPLSHLPPFFGGRERVRVRERHQSAKLKHISSHLTLLNWTRKNAEERRIF
jgi:hypothetical protein